MVSLFLYFGFNRQRFAQRRLNGVKWFIKKNSGARSQNSEGL
jgi:hypothetical protein